MVHLLPWQCPLRIRYTNFRSFIYSHSSTNPTNLVKIGLVDVETIGLTEIVKIYETMAEHKPAFGPGGLIKVRVNMRCFTVN